MSNLVSVPKNGSLANSNSNQNLPTLSNWLDDIFNRDLPSVFTSNFNTGITLPRVNIKENAGTPCFFTIRGDEVEFDRVPDKIYTVTFTYFAGFQPLTDANQTNIVLTKYPNIYLFGCLRQVFLYAQDTQQASIYSNEALSAVQSANKAEKEGRYGPQPQMTSKWAP